MKVLLTILFIISFGVNAEEYKAPKIESIDWKIDKTKVVKDTKWTSDYKMIDAGEYHPAEPDANAQIRKPSSGDEEKPKFWDFKSVK